MTRSRRRKLERARTAHTSRKALNPLPWGPVLLAAVPTAFAQQRDTSTGLEEVVVSAQKRDENLQNVPLSIQAFGTEKLQELNVQSFDDYAKFLPSLSYQSLGPGFARIFMRGVASGDNGNHSGPTPSVGMYLDEQPITTITGPLDIHVYDIARVEALAGPQGTLYGASSQAGTIRIITNKPDPTKFSSSYDLQLNTTAHGEEGYGAEGYVNIPINERMAIRLVGWAEHEGGYIDNVAGTRTFPISGATNDNSAVAEDDYNDTDTFGARAALRIDLNDNWTVTPTLIGQQSENDGIFASDEGVGELAVSHIHPEGAKDRWVQAALTVEGRISNLDLVYAGAFLKRDVDSRSDYADYSYFYDVCCSYGYYVTDDDGNVINPSQFITAQDGYKKSSHELRLSSSPDNRFRWVGGLFFQRQLHEIEQRYQIDGFGLPVEGWPNTIWLTQQERTDRDYAAFGEVTYDFTEKLAGTAGIRFFRAKNSLIGFFGFSDEFSGGTGEAACFDPNGVNGAPCTNLDTTVKENDSTHKLNLTYRIDDTKLVYATWSEGFRPGGVNRRGNFPPYDADFLTNYEFGWKTTWAGNRMRMNGALFWQDWDDFQFSYLGLNGLTNVTNAGAARIKGIETDIEWAATDALMISTGFTLLDPELAEDFCKDLDLSTGQPQNPCLRGFNLAPSGQRLPVTPKFKGSVTARYEFPLAGFNAHMQGSFVYTGSRTSAMVPAEADLLGLQRSYGLADFSFGVRKDRFSAELFVNNAFDKRADLFRYAECSIIHPTNEDLTPLCGNQPYVVTNRPRVIGLKFGQSF
jgi:iron complex outermembrane receptor protein